MTTEQQPMSFLSGVAVISIYFHLEVSWIVLTRGNLKYIEK